MSWDEPNGSVWNPVLKKYETKAKRAVGLCEGTWFMEAINALRDGDMGEEGPDGVYSRIWASDDIYNTEVTNVREASPAEVELWLAHCSIMDTIWGFYGPVEDNYIFVRGTESYVLVRTS